MLFVRPARRETPKAGPQGGQSIARLRRACPPRGWASPTRPWRLRRLPRDPNAAPGRPGANAWRRWEEDGALRGAIWRAGRGWDALSAGYPRLGHALRLKYAAARPTPKPGPALRAWERPSRACPWQEKRASGPPPYGRLLSAGAAPPRPLGLRPPRGLDGRSVGPCRLLRRVERVAPQGQTYPRGNGSRPAGTR